MRETNGFLTDADSASILFFLRILYASLPNSNNYAAFSGSLLFYASIRFNVRLLAWNCSSRQCIFWLLLSFSISDFSYGSTALQIS